MFDISIIITVIATATANVIIGLLSNY